MVHHPDKRICESCRDAIEIEVGTVSRDVLLEVAISMADTLPDHLCDRIELQGEQIIICDCAGHTNA